MTEFIANTKEWLDHRKNFIGASDAAIILGLSPWRTPIDLWKEKLGLGGEQKQNAWMHRGLALEPIARDLYIEHVGVYVEPKMIVHPEIPYMMANLDGISEDGKKAVEIKCPGKVDHEHAKNGHVPLKYMPQLQHQLAVIGLDHVDYFSYRDNEFILIQVERDNEFIKNLIEKEKYFWDCVLNFKEPTELLVLDKKE